MSDWIPSKSPAFAGAALGMLVSVSLFGYGMWSFFQPEPPPLPQSFGLVVAGFVNWVSCFYTMRRVRVAWSFAVSLNGTGAVIFLFGAPKVRDAFDIGLALSIVPCLVFVAATALLAMSGEEME